MAKELTGHNGMLALANLDPMISCLSGVCLNT